MPVPTSDETLTEELARLRQRVAELEVQLATLPAAAPRTDDDPAWTARKESVSHTGPSATGPDASLPAAAAVNAPLLQTITDNMVDLVTLTDLDGRIIYASPSHRQLGYEPGSMLGQMGASLVHPEDRPVVAQAFGAGLSASVPRKAEYRLANQGDRELWVETTGRLLNNEQGEPTRMIFSSHDVTARRRAEQRLQTSEAQMRAILDGISTNLAFVNRDLEIQWANKCAAFSVGRTPEEMIGRRCHALWADPSKPCENCPTERAFETRRTERTTVVTPDGRTWEETGEPVFDERGELLGVVEIAIDVTERRRTEQELDRQRFHLEKAQEIGHIGTWDLDARTNTLVWTDENYRILGVPLGTPLTYESFLACVLPDDRAFVAAAWEAALGGEPYDIEHRILADGQVRWVREKAVLEYDESGACTRGVGFTQDITDRKQAERERLELEAKFLQAQKLESLGVLAGGVAHDFNNLLVGILGNASVALAELGPDAPSRECLADIESAARQAAQLASQMLAYAGKGHLTTAPVRLEPTIQQIVHLLEAAIPKKIAIDLALDGAVPEVDADATQLRQIIMNLVINASEAIGDRSGTITIRTGARDCDRAYLDALTLHAERPVGTYSYVEVSDDGCGMDRATLDRIFDPFFTTKFPGRGLGLPAMLGIVRGHQGAVEVTSAPGEGTTFRVLLPALSAAPATRSAEAPQEGRSLRGKTVLVVDDEPIIVMAARRMLERLGVTVVAAENGRVALDVFGDRPDRFDCVLLDLTMPELGGEEVLREIYRLRPETRVVLSSGYGESDRIDRCAALGLAAFLPKPYDPSKLKAALSRALFGDDESLGSVTAKPGAGR